MKAIFFYTIFLAALLLSGVAPANAQAQAGRLYTAQTLGPQQLERLLAPVALYPDPLLAQILPAATAADDIRRADAFLRGSGYQATSAVNGQNWNVSVRSLSHYPTVIRGMASDRNWTIQVGQAFVTQQRDVLDAVQRLRRYAYRSGLLRSTLQQRVIVTGDTIIIYSAQASGLYIPQYDPRAFWIAPGVLAGGAYITYSAPCPVGPWLNLDCNWDRGEVYYHGWNGGGPWVSLYRPSIQIVNGSVYINDSYNNNFYYTNNNVVYLPVTAYTSVTAVYPSFSGAINRPPVIINNTKPNRPIYGGGVSHPTGSEVVHPGGFRP